MVSGLKLGTAEMLFEAAQKKVKAICRQRKANQPLTLYSFNGLFPILLSHFLLHLLNDSTFLCFLHVRCLIHWGAIAWSNMSLLFLFLESNYRSDV